MKTNFLTLLLLLTTLSYCQQLTSLEIAKTYYEAKNDLNFNKLKAIINDSITLTEGPHIMPYSRESFYEFFKWDSVFKPTYKVIDLKTEGDCVISTISQANIRNQFLQNNPLTFKQKIQFKAGKIHKIASVDYIDVNWQTWETEKVKLINWIKKNHPELDGCVNDMTMKGATNYVKAIELYKMEAPK